MAGPPEDVDNYYAEAAADEIFSGPTHEQIPSSYSSFHYQGHQLGRSRSRSRSRSQSQSQHRDSVVSRSSRPESIYSLNSQVVGEDGAHGRRPSDTYSQFHFFSRDEVKRAEGSSTVLDDEPEDFGSQPSDYTPDDHMSPRSSVSHTHRPFFDEYSDDEPLLASDEARAPTTEHVHIYPASTRQRQRYYISEEDLRIVCAGYRRVKWRKAAYIALCVFTLGLGYLFLRWFPRWRISWLAREAALGNCDLVVIENQWGDLEFVDVVTHRYNESLSTIFNLERLAAEEEEAGPVPAANPADRSAEEPEYVDKDPNVPYLRMLSYRYLRFYYNPTRDLFMTNSDWVSPEWIDHEMAIHGMETEVQARREMVFGSNALDIKQPTTMKLLVDEVLHPFYVFQIFSIILWAFDDFMYYATAIFLVSLGSVLEALFETKKNLSRLGDITRYEAEVRVIRSGFWVTMPSSGLLPGDVYEVSDPALSMLPCDSILLSGDCIVNESILTGESVPVSKVAANDEVLQKLVKEGPGSVSSSFLYSGTKLIRVRKPILTNADVFEGALAMAVRTGFSTTKGSLVRSMLFPKPSGFKFYRDSFRYIGVMAIVAVLGFLVSLISFIKMELETSLIIMRALDLITIVVPPALPATLTIGTNISLSRLRKRQIFCITPSRTNVGGRIDIVCFDKTGTLTEDGLDVLGVHVHEIGKADFGPLIKRVENLPQTRLLSTLATCHELREVNHELIGDPLDIKMFEFTKWKFSESAVHNSRMAESPDGRTQLHVAKQFEFVSKLRRMAVVVTGSGTGPMVLVKGAPEVMRAICKPESIPAEFDNLLHRYTHGGYRVIACASRQLDGIADYDRDDLERDLDFSGFIIFENRLKASTSGVIKELSTANIRTTMCTGDNLLTAVSVARECHILEPRVEVYAAHFTEFPHMPLRWESVDHPEMLLDDTSLLPIGKGPAGGLYSLAISGDVFGWLVNHGTDEQIQQMLIKGAVFARMSPDEKHELVSKLQQIDYTTCFCGDGANDVGALKEADVGISLSEAEASVAAPFTSRIFEITCVIDVIREGRCALTTSFSCFQFMSMYSAIQFITVGILYGYGSNIGDFQFLWIDLFLIVPLACFMAWSEPWPVLSTKRPNAKLVSRKVLVPLIGSVIAVGLFQTAAWYYAHQQPWYVAPDPGNNDNLKSSDNTALFDVSCFQYIMVAWILCRGLPYRKPVYTNIPFLVTVLVCSLSTLFFIFVDPATGIGRLMDLSPTDMPFKVTMIVLVVLNFVTMEVLEKTVYQKVQTVIAGLKRTMGVRKVRKTYKLLLENSRTHV